MFVIISLQIFQSFFYVISIKSQGVFSLFYGESTIYDLLHAMI